MASGTECKLAAALTVAAHQGHGQTYGTCRVKLTSITYDIPTRSHYPSTALQKQYSWYTHRDVKCFRLVPRKDGIRNVLFLQDFVLYSPKSTNFENSSVKREKKEVLFFRDVHQSNCRQNASTFFSKHAIN